MKTCKGTLNRSASAEESTITAETRNVNEVDNKQRLQDAIKAIRTNYKECCDGQKKTDRAATKIGQELLKIETDKLFKQDVSKQDGKPITSMAQFIANNFEFKYQYAIMLKQSARVQQILKLDDEVSFRLLRSLNRFTEKPAVMEAIWKEVMEMTNNQIPDKKTLNAAIRKWEVEHPEEASGKKQQPVSLDSILKKDDLSLKEIGFVLGKWTPQTIDQETEKLLLKKIQVLLHELLKETDSKTESK